ncbi:hypothetical protein BMR1_03g02680 [Babesia microti strain RI]|uniref:Cyclin-dependent kinases regulatory subunit n=1 Tax=Babesia microti (strain RI) TaxID=1133968 RepID=A0A0K3AU65_BABMR|nr:hypothetical protein BMR1_03g02680 [Babesia microti strain RI]CTQ41136.1 hypothetical protein BMR1_03g02680 [Babesia microti strain RI]|eukprot:XP_012649147.1 hypothetical protein BMR1_03g02680 [Babesia microti strain RI]
MNNNRNSGLDNKGNSHYISQKSHAPVDRSDYNCTQSQSRLVGRRNVFSAHLNGELQPQRSLITLTELNINKHPNLKPQHNPFDKYGCILPRKPLRETLSAPAIIKTTRSERRNYNIPSDDNNSSFLTQPANTRQQHFDSNPQNIIHTVNIHNTIPNTLPNTTLNYGRSNSRSTTVPDEFNGLEMGTPLAGHQTYREEATVCQNVGPVEAAKRYLKDAFETRRATSRADMAHDIPDFYNTNEMLTGRQFWHKLFQPKYINRTTLDPTEAASSTNILKRHKSIDRSEEATPPKGKLQEISKLLKSAKESTNIESFEQSLNKLQNVVNLMLYEQLLPTMDNLDSEYSKPVTIQPEDIPTVREISMNDNAIECDNLVYDACTMSAKRNLDGLGTHIGEIYDVNDEFMSTDPVDYATLVTRFGKVFYSPKFQTDKYVYRYIILPKQSQDAAEALCKQRAILKNSGQNEINSPVIACEKSKFVRFLDEPEILRQLGIHMSSGWQHFFVFKNSIKEIILRRKI